MSYYMLQFDTGVLRSFSLAANPACVLGGEVCRGLAAEITEFNRALLLASCVLQEWKGWNRKKSGKGV